jgi:hypothetical protein
MCVDLSQARQCCSGPTVATSAAAVGCFVVLVVQVERLSALVERAKELQLDAQLRLEVINSSVNIHTRIVKFFELVENDLYGKLQSSSAQIAVYRG